MRNIVKGLMVASLVVSSGAFADNMYVSIGGGMGKISTVTSTRDFPLLNKSPGLTPTDINSVKLFFKNSKNIVGAIGYQFGDVRTELAINSLKANYKKFSQDAIYYFPSDYLSGKVAVNSVFLNGYYDFNLNEVLTPYIGAGVGMAKIKNTLYHYGLHSYINGVWTALSTFKADMSQTLPAYQLIAGTKINLTGQLSLTADYRFFSTVNTIKALNNRLKNHSVNVGLMFGF
jgi:opacity protein-like surface antigen